MKISSVASFCAAAFMLTAALSPAVAQTQTANPVTTALKAYLQHSSHVMAAAAEEMPADKYSYRPTAGSRSFAELVLHIGNANRMACHWLSGAPAAAKSTLTAASSKDQLVASLKDSFNYCSNSLNNLNDSKLANQVPFFGGRKLTVAASVLELAGDWSDHYSQEAAYLRANGMMPPTAHHGKP